MRGVRVGIVGGGVLLGCSSAEELGCEGACIRLEKVVTLGADDGPGALAGIPLVARDSRGRYYVTLPDLRGEPPFVFDADGRFLRRLGSEGEGPGEFVNPTRILVDEGDTLHVFDAATGRLTVLDPDYDLLRTASPVPSQHHAIRLPGGAYVVNDGTRPYPYSLYDARGDHLESLGDSVSRHRNDASWRLGRALAPARSGGFWGATLFFRHELEHRDANGELVFAFSPDPEWFVQDDSLRFPTLDEPPSPWIGGIWEDGLGMLWITGAAPDPQWRRGLGRPRRGEGGRRYYPIEDDGAVFDAVLEVIDPRTREVLATRRLPDPHWRLVVVEPGMVASVRESEWGWWYADVYRVSYGG